MAFSFTAALVFAAFVAVVACIANPHHRMRINQMPRSMLNCTSADMMRALSPAGAIDRFVSGPNATMFFLQFGKVGSSTVRNFLYKKHPVPDLGEPHFMTSSGREDARLARGSFGGCNQIWMARAGRPCVYLAVFRHPVARIISSFAYFCLACAEGGRKCRPRTPMYSPFAPRTCPNITVTEHAQLEGLHYVERLSGLAACASCDLSTVTPGSLEWKDRQLMSPRPFRTQCDRHERTGVGPAATSYGDAVAGMLAQAKINLRHGVLPLILEESLDEGMALAAKVFRARELVPRRALGRHNTGAQQAQRARVRPYNISAFDVARLESYLAPDIELYEYARQLYHEYKSNYSHG